MNAESLGQRIKQKRQILGMTQEELAKKLKVTSQYISAIELDKRLPSLNFLARLAEELSATTDFLLTGKQHCDGSDAITAIMADQSLPDEVKKSLAVVVKFLQCLVVSNENPESDLS
jgi:transcriptional regulator with XRE-family HTH domain